MRGIGDGSLAEDRFRLYLRQDYVFLIDYGRLLALGAVRAPRLEWMRRLAALGDFAELTAALLPCMWGYAEIGERLAAAGSPEHPGYAAWIAEYASPEFAELAAWTRALVDAAAEEAGPAVRARMHVAFGTCSELELGFWDSGWNATPDAGTISRER